MHGLGITSLPDTVRGGSSGILVSVMAIEDEESSEMALWRSALDALLAKGATFEEAVDGANLLLEGHRRQMKELARRAQSTASMRTSGVRKKST